MKEWNICFACNSSRKQSLPCSRFSGKKYSFWNLCTNVKKLFWVSQKSFLTLVHKFQKEYFLPENLEQGRLCLRELLQAKQMFHSFIFLDQNLLKCLLELEHHVFEIYSKWQRKWPPQLFLLMKSMQLDVFEEQVLEEETMNEN